MGEIDQFAVLRKIRNRMGCENFSSLARKVGMDLGGITSMKKERYRISARLILNVATVLDISPKKLLTDMNMPEDYFLRKKDI